MLVLISDAMVKSVAKVLLPPHDGQLRRRCSSPQRRSADQRPIRRARAPIPNPAGSTQCKGEHETIRKVLSIDGDTDTLVHGTGRIIRGKPVTQVNNLG
jgi:hypothetical protein